MKELYRRFGWVTVFAIAMALLEAAVVVYLRGLLNITDQLVVSLGTYERIEIWREAATLVMLACAGWLAGRGWQDRAAYAMFTFGMWDIWYYVWLKLMIDWPVTLLDWDILFLIPLRWWGPVLAPVLIAALLCVTSLLAVVRLERGEQLAFTPIRSALALLGGLLALYAFMADAIHGLLRGVTARSVVHPAWFNWPLFVLALTTMTVSSLSATWPRLERPRRASLVRGEG
jgi:hypothetical protein